MKSLFLSASFFLIWMFVALSGFSAGVESGTEKVVSQPVTGDLYISGSTITVNAKIDGDLVAAGGTISVNDSVTGDVLMGGGTLLLNGFVGDDIRAGGGTISIDKNVMGDVVVAGGTVVISQQVIIAGDLIITSGKATVNGLIRGKAKLIGGELYLNGTIEKDLEVQGGKLFINGTVQGKSKLAAEQISIQDQARFHQDVTYWHEAGPIDFGKAIVDGKANFNPDMQMDVSDSRWYFLGFGSMIFVLLYLASILLLLFLFQYVFSTQLQKAGSAIAQETVKVFGFGMLYLIGLPVIAIFLLITVIGIPVGLFALIFYIFSVALAHVISSLVAVNWYNNQYHQNWPKHILVWSAFAAFLCIKLITLLPFFGWIASVILVGMAFGAIIDSLRKKQLPALA